MKDKAKVLIIDDDQYLVESLKLMISQEGYQVLNAKNTSLGWEIVQNEKPDLIILDVMMDETFEGFEFSKKLRRHAESAEIPVIMITGISKELNLPFSFEEDRDKLPVNKILNKPVVPRQLLQAINSYLKCGQDRVK